MIYDDTHPDEDYEDFGVEYEFTDGGENNTTAHHHSTTHTLSVKDLCPPVCWNNCIKFCPPLCCRPNPNLNPNLNPNPTPNPKRIVQTLSGSSVYVP